MLVGSIKEMVATCYLQHKDEAFLYEKKQDSFVMKTRGETIEAIWTLAQALIQRGYKDKKIAIIGENSYEWAVTYMAVAGYAGIAVLIDKEYTSFDYDNIFRVIDDISLVIYSEHKEQLISEVRKKHPQPEYLCLQTEVRMLMDTDRLQDDHSLGAKDPNKMCEIVFTSGTTARPKAIMLSQVNLLANLENLLKRTPMNNEDTAYLVLPLHHLYAGVHLYLYSYYTGVSIYLGNLMDLKKDLQQLRPTVFIGVPMIYEMLLEQARKTNTKSLMQLMGGRMKYIFCGGAKFKEETKRAYYDQGIDILDAYGVSEMSSVISFSYMGEPFNLSQGTVFENQQVKIIDKDKDKDKAGYGEIIVRGENMMLGYYHDEEATRKKIDDEGFLHTGDIGCLDEQGRLYVAGRKTRLITTGNGKNVYPDEIEELLMGTGKMVRAKVYEENHRIAALIISDEDPKVLDKEIEKINIKLPDYKKIKIYEIIPAREKVFYK